MNESILNLPDGRELRAECEMIEVTSNLPRPDKAWTFTDAQGHEHAWSQGWPSLRWVVDEPETDDWPEEGHYECLLCGETIAPGMSGPSMFREFIPGVVSYYLDNEPISREEYDAIVGR